MLVKIFPLWPMAWIPPTPSGMQINSTLLTLLNSLLLIRKGTLRPDTHKKPVYILSHVVIFAGNHPVSDSLFANMTTQKLLLKYLSFSTVFSPLRPETWRFWRLVILKFIEELLTICYNEDFLKRVNNCNSLSRTIYLFTVILEVFPLLTIGLG